MPRPSDAAPEIVVADPASVRLQSLALRTAGAADSAVLLRGESGVGKTLWAKWIHLASPRRDAPLVFVDCASIPEGLLESDLFGHAKGAFTDAHAAKPGRLELADGGTVVLENLGEMPSALQAKLLRVIEEKSVTPVGGTKPRALDVRFLACAPADVEALIRSRLLREDLYYRLNVVPLDIAPLRDRPGDIEPLARFFLRRATERRGEKPRAAEDAVFRALALCPWPGNVRELENVLERALALAGAEAALSMKHFPSLAMENSSSTAERAAERGLTLEEMTLLYIEQTLARAGGNISEAARRLGISRRTLYERRRKGFSSPRGGSEE